MNKFPLISIAIPVFNEAGSLKRCLDSIFRQNYPGRLEVFVVDDNSTDDTVKTARKFPVTVLKNGYRDCNVGKKIGLDRSGGKYFMFLDADIELDGSDWFTKLVRPLETDSTLCASFTGYFARDTDSPLNKYISLDFLQRDPLFMWLTPSLNRVVTERSPRWVVCKYSRSSMLPSGLCLYRKALLDKYVKLRKKFLELDTVAILVNNGHDRFAYVPDAGMHHPFIVTFKELVFKRMRNLSTMYFNQPDPRAWTWINWDSPSDVIKLLGWVIYANSLILPLLAGVFKSVKYKTRVGLYELPFVFITTNLLIWGFVSSKHGRGLAVKILNLRQSGNQV